MINVVKYKGKYKGKILEWNVGKAKRDDPENNGLQFVIKAEITKKQNGKVYEDIVVKTDETNHVMGYMVLITADGSVNKRQVDTLKQALNWDGASLKALQNGDYSEKEYDFTISIGEENKKPRIDWINSGGFVPSESQLDELDQLWASKNTAADLG